MEPSVVVIGVLLRAAWWLLRPLFWLAGRARAGAWGGVAPPDPSPLLQLSALDIAAKIRSGELSSERVVSAYIARIRAVEPHVHAVSGERFAAALADARAADLAMTDARAHRRDQEFDDKPLWGVPFTVKESLQVEGLSNSVGCLEWAGRAAAADGAAVRRVRRAGAVPLCVTNTAEYCLGWEATNPLRARTRNPAGLARAAGGSSGGEAALLGCGASPFGLTSDIAGSTRVPAAFCGVFGHKPTPGFVPVEGHIPFVDSPLFAEFLCCGPSARRAGDLAPLLRVLAGPRARDLRLDQPVDLRKLRVYYMTEASNSIAMLPTEPCVAAAVLRAARCLSDAGAELCEEKFPEFEDSVEMSISVFFSMENIPDMLTDLADPTIKHNFLLSLVRCAWGGARRSLQALGFALVSRTRLGLGAAARARHRAAAAALGDKLARTLGSDGVLLYPVFPERAPPLGAVLARAAGVAYTMLFNVLGCPATAVPVPVPVTVAGRGGDGSGHELPAAVQVIAAPGQDRLCLAVAVRLEEALGGWRMPGL